MLARDPYCPLRIAPDPGFPQRPELDTSEKLVHMDYLCTWIGRPRSRSRHPSRRATVKGDGNGQHSD